MKIALVLMFSLLATNAFANTQTISDRDSDEARASLPILMVSALRDSGFKFKAANDGNFVISLKNLRCDYTSNNALDFTSPQAYIPRNTCHFNTEKNSLSKKGKLLPEASGVMRLLEQLDLADCGSGHCDMWVKAVNCVVDTKVEASTGNGRISCTVEDDRE